MKKKLILLSVITMASLATTGCTKRCRCISYNTSVDYFTPEEVSALGKTCSEMRYLDGLSVQRYSVCEWVYGE